MLLENVKKILLIQLGDIGDVVWMTPTLWAIKAACPQADLFILLREGNGALLEADPSVYGTIEIKKYRGSLYERLQKQSRFIMDFRRERFDMVIDLRAGDRGAIMARLSGAPVRVAQYYQGLPFWRNRFFTRLVRPCPQEKNDRGAAEQSLRIIRELGIEAQAAAPRLWVREEVKKSAGTLLREAGIDIRSRWVSLNPFSRWSYKELPYHKWIEIIDWIWKEFHLASVIVGSEAESKKAAKLTDGCSGKVYNLAGRTNLAELAALIGFSSLHIGVDSAAPHIAAAVGTPTVTIYGPSDWQEWAPRGEHHRVVVAGEECVPCYRKGCDNSNVSKCLENIMVEKIEKTIREALISFPLPPQSA